MASGTAYYNLRKDASTDNYDVAVVNQNLDDIDAQMHQNELAATTPFVGADSSTNGEKGIVPRPMAGDEDKYLKGDGTWDTPSGGGGGSSTLVGLTDVDISSPTNGQVLKYNSTTQKWENADESGSSQRTYLGQLIPRVSASDSKITASTSNSSYSAWGAFNGTSPSNLSSPGANSCWLPEANLTDQWIKYHFDAQRYFTKIVITCFSNYSSDWVGDIKVEGSTDGLTWTNILASGTTYELTAELRNSTTVEINLDDADLWEYIRVTFVDEMSVAYQPSCFVDEIYVYGGEEISGSSSAEEMTLAEYNALTTEQKNDGTIRFIPAGSGSEASTAVDMTDITAYKENSMNITAVSSSEIDVTLAGGQQIGCNFDFNTPINVTDYDSITFKVTNGTCYNNGEQAMYPRWDMMIGLMSAPLGQLTVLEPTDSRWVVVADMPLSNHVYEETLDVSGLTGNYYIVVCAHGWNTVIEDITLTAGGIYPSQIKYMSKTYADGTDGGGNPELEETALLTTPITAEGTYTLLDNIEDYDFVSFVSGVSNEADIRLFAVSDMLNMLDDNLIINCAGTNGRWFNITALSGTSITITKYSETIIHSIMGYKIKGGGGSSSHTYSTTEQKVGTWIDGKPIFQKTIYYAGEVGSSTVVDNTITSSDIDYFVCTELSYYCNGSYRGSGLQLEVAPSSTGIIVSAANAPNARFEGIYATIRYTKVSTS